MPIRIYNSLTRTKEEFVPLEEGTVKMYACGVTVYDQCHIGHARSLYVFEVIKRYLRFKGYDVRFVRNITDIDDKIINKAKELGKSSEEVARENIEGYKKDLKDLGLEEADCEPKATENIQEIIEAISTLVDKGFAYAVDGDVYFSVRTFKDYGKLSGQSIEHMIDAVRIEADEKKKDPLDFALWKSSGEGEPFWESPWGKGRPGWHIECSCMSMKHLNRETLDIHAGGRDLIFPHHENEVAQSEALTGKPFAKYWIHHGLLTINGQKMAKSLGNFITIQDAVQKYGVDALKMFFLSSQYMSPVDFTDEKIREADKALQRIDILYWKASEKIKGTNAQLTNADFVEKRKDEFLEAMDDDFNTPRALGSIFELVNDTHKYIEERSHDPRYADTIYTAVNTMDGYLKDIFGLYVHDRKINISTEDQALLDERRLARENKDFKRSDELRDELKAKGIIVEDTKDGQTWRWA